MLPVLPKKNATVTTLQRYTFCVRTSFNCCILGSSTYRASRASQPSDMCVGSRLKSFVHHPSDDIAAKQETQGYT